MLAPYLGAEGLWCGLRVCREWRSTRGALITSARFDLSALASCIAGGGGSGSMMSVVTTLTAALPKLRSLSVVIVADVEQWANPERVDDDDWVAPWAGRGGMLAQALGPLSGL